MENTLNKTAFAKLPLAGTSIAGLMLLASVTGCHHDAIVHGETFTPDTQPTSIGRIDQAQDATGAAADGMLYDMHFHGDQLNSLGQVKLDLIRKGTPAGDPVVIHFDMPHDQFSAREAAVSAYLKTAGLADTQIALVEGINPNNNTPTAYNMTGLYKSDGTSFNGQAAADTGAGGLSGGSTTK
jgi:hypothetical protein